MLKPYKYKINPNETPLCVLVGRFVPLLSINEF